MIIDIRDYVRREGASPLVYLTNNALSFAGVAIVTTATVFWLFLLPTTLKGEPAHPYVGILIYLLIPAFFFLGLLLIPAGIWLKDRRLHHRGLYPSSFPPFTLGNPDLRRLALFIGATTFANIVIASQLTYEAVNYMDTVTFCGQTCHTVMQPEFTAHQDSPHARVACVECHIGPGASWFVRSKLSGTGQVFATVFNYYPRPIPTPVQNLRPARETCEVCHWPEKFSSDKLVVETNFADDEKNTMTKTVLLMKIGGGPAGRGIHGMHVGPGIHIRYASDPSRQNIPWVSYTAANGVTTTYAVAGAKTAGLETREMDCIDCHNRPAHGFQMPDRALDAAMAAGSVSPALPFAKHVALDLLRKPYATRALGGEQIPAAFESYYRTNYAALYNARRAEVERSARGVLAVWRRNIFPAMRITWGTYPSNIGHMDFPGCFRCHDGSHNSPAGASITQDCGACHNLLATEESAPKILTDLGMTP
jgi:nitrate/TMAO reductase-like tetraheme cytochrome c subunit